MAFKNVCCLYKDHIAECDFILLPSWASNHWMICVSLLCLNYQFSLMQVTLRYFDITNSCIFQESFNRTSFTDHETKKQRDVFAWFTARHWLQRLLLHWSLQVFSEQILRVQKKFRIMVVLFCAIHPFACILFFVLWLIFHWCLNYLNLPYRWNYIL